MVRGAFAAGAFSGGGWAVRARGYVWYYFIIISGAGWLAGESGRPALSDSQCALPAPAAHSFLPPCASEPTSECVCGQQQRRRPSGRLLHKESERERRKSRPRTLSRALHVIWVVVCSNRSVLYVCVAHSKWSSHVCEEFFLAAPCAAYWKSDSGHYAAK